MNFNFLVVDCKIAAIGLAQTTHWSFVAAFHDNERRDRRADTSSERERTETSRTMAKTVLVTGATRGVGLQFAEHYAKLGWNVIAAARDPSNAEMARLDLKWKLTSLSPYKIVQMDSSDEASIVRAATQLDGEPIDVLINNAGVLFRDDLASTTKEDLLRTFEVNSVGPFLVTRVFLPHLKLAVAQHGSASVMQISSQLGSIERNLTGKLCSYRASKAAVNMINSSLAVDLKSENIAAVVVHPGYVATDMNSHQGTISAETSVTGLVDVIDKLTLADTGKFFDYAGESLPW
ncbi:Short chain dehydrogenase, partial [Globisporangium splendens]